MNKIFTILKLILPAFLLFFICYSCAKEYSGVAINTTVLIDTIINPAPAIKPYVCPACIGNENFQENKWNFRDNTLLRCGIIDTAIVNPERTGFTFFGPSSCSKDTGIIMTVLLDTLHLNRDIYNITYSRSAFYYYDNVRNTYIYMNRQQSPFTVTIESYTHIDRMITGSFSGIGYKTAGGSVSINSGRFKVKLL